MSRRDELLAKANANIRSTAEISDDEVRVRSAAHKPRSGQGSFAQRQKLEDRIQELENRLTIAGGSESDIDVDAISPNPWQPRRVFDETEIQKLANSIQEVGLIQPVIVRSVRTSDTLPDANGGVRTSDTSYQLVAGERRLRAHRLLGRERIRAVVIDASDETMAALALAENVDREDLTDYEIAVAIRNAEEAFPNRTRLAEALGIARTELYQYLSFFKLPAFVIDDLEVTPALLGRTAAEDVVAVLKKCGAKAEASLGKLWPRVRGKELDQGKLAAMIEAASVQGGAVQGGREIKKLFLGDAQVGSITRDAAGISIKIRAAALTSERETELKAFVERLFGDQ